MGDDEKPLESGSEPQPVEPPAPPPEDESPFEIQPLDLVQRGFVPPNIETRDGD
jgi:hypothetical protein